MGISGMGVILYCVDVNVLILWESVEICVQTWGLWSVKSVVDEVVI